MWPPQSFSLQSCSREFLEAETLMLSIYLSMPFKNISLESYLRRPDLFYQISCWYKLFPTIHKMAQSRNKKHTFSLLLSFENVMQILMSSSCSQSGNTQWLMRSAEERRWTSPSWGQIWQMQRETDVQIVCLSVENWAARIQRHLKY